MMKKTALTNLDLDIYEEELDNGLKVFVIPKKDVNNIYATFSTDYGSIQNEFVPIGSNQMVRVPDGVAHFLEHKVFEQKNGEEPFEFFAKSGTDCNANTSNYKTTYLFIGQEQLKENLNYLIDFVMEPYFTDKNVEKEKGIIEQELKMYQDDPNTASMEKIIYNTFINNPIKLPVGGTVESIKKITKEDLYTCYNTFYHPSNMFIVVTGNVDPEEVINIVKDNMKNRKFEKENKIKLKEYDEPDNVEKEEESLYLNVTKPRVLIGYKINIEDTKLNRRTINNFIGMFSDLKFGPVSLFGEELKKDKIITEDIMFSTLKTDKHILLILEAQTDKKDEFIKRVEKELKNFNITEQEFNRKRKTAISSCIYMSDSIYSLNSFVMNSLTSDKKVEYKLYDHYKKLKYEDFKKFIETRNFDNKTVLYVEPKN